MNSNHSQPSGDPFEAFFGTPNEFAKEFEQNEIASDRKLFESAFEKGLEFMQQQAWEAALEQFSVVIKLAPKEAPAFSNRARCYWQLKRLPEAQADIENALRRDPHELEDWIALGEVNCQRENQEMAIRVLEKAQEMLTAQTSRGHRERLYHHLSLAYFRTNRFALALTNVNEAIIYSNPNNPWLLNLRGMIYEAQGDTNSALNDINRAIEIEKGDSAFYANRAKIWHALMDEEKMQSDLHVTIALLPNDPHEILDTGSLIYELGSPLAERCFSKAIELNPEFANAYQLRAHFYSETDPHRALGDIERAIRIDSQNAHAQVLYGSILSHLKQYQKALAATRRGVELEPNCPQYRCLLGHCYLDLQKYHQCLTAFEVALKLDKRCIEGYVGRGVLFFELGDFKSAIREAELALALAPNDSHALELRGSAQGELGHLRESIQDLRKALAHSNEKQRIRASIAMAFVKLNDPSSAIEQLNHIDPDTSLLPEVHYVRAELEKSRQQNDLALKHIQTAIELDDSDSRFYQTQGEIQLSLANRVAARNSYVKALEREKNRAKIKELRKILESIS